MNYTKLTIKINSSDKPPYFVGSQLRGAFGYALKNIEKNVENSLYSKFFEKKNEIHQYRFDIRLSLQFYEFSFYLFDDSCDEIFIVISAFYEMLTNIGLGKENKIYKDFEIYLNDNIIYQNGNLKEITDYIKTFNQAKKYKDEIILTLVTPLRIKKDGKFVIDDNLEFESILKSIYQRSLAIKNSEFEKIPFKPRYKIKSKDIYFNDLKRFSNLQNSSMNLGGLMGEFWISNLDEKSYQLLKLGELIGVGKQTVFGLGKINIKGVK